jgi:hypothetical protein
MSMQKQVMSALKEVAESSGYVFQQNGNWANTGNVNITPKGTFKAALGFHYDFQSSWQRLSIDVFQGGAKIVGGMCARDAKGHLRTFFLDYHQGSEIERMIGWFRERLPVINKPLKGELLNDEQTERLFANFNELFAAADALYNRCCDMTSDEFAKGGEKAERERLASILNLIEKGDPQKERHAG